MFLKFFSAEAYLSVNRDYNPRFGFEFTERTEGRGWDVDLFLGRWWLQVSEVAAAPVVDPATGKYIAPPNRSMKAVDIFVWRRHVQVVGPSLVPPPEPALALAEGAA